MLLTYFQSLEICYPVMVIDACTQKSSSESQLHKLGCCFLGYGFLVPWSVYWQMDIEPVSPVIVPLSSRGWL